MNKRILTFVISILLCATAFGQADEAYTKTLQKMFEVSGTEDTYQAAIDQMISMFKQQYTQVDSNVWVEFKKEFSQTSLDELTNMLAPVYAKYLTKDDLEELIKFYNSSIGKKFAKSTPLIMKESMQIGQQWGMKMGKEFQEKMKEKGY